MTDPHTGPSNSPRDRSQSEGSPDPESDPEPGRPHRVRRWAFYLIGAVLLAVLLREVLYPFSDQPYMEISHGNHVHYVPKDRNETVPVSAFPMRPPESDERITPDGDIVPNE